MQDNESLKQEFIDDLNSIKKQFESDINNTQSTIQALEDKWRNKFDASNTSGEIVIKKACLTKCDLSSIFDTILSISNQIDDYYHMENAKNADNIIVYHITTNQDQPAVLVIQIIPKKYIYCINIYFNGEKIDSYETSKTYDKCPDEYHIYRWFFPIIFYLCRNLHYKHISINTLDDYLKKSDDIYKEVMNSPATIIDLSPQDTDKGFNRAIFVQHRFKSNITFVTLTPNSKVPWTVRLYPNEPFSALNSHVWRMITDYNEFKRKKYEPLSRSKLVIDNVKNLKDFNMF